MPEVRKRVLRAKLDTLADLPGALEVAHWRANALDVEVGIFEGSEVLSISDVESVNCRVQPSQTVSDVLMIAQCWLQR